MKTCKYEMPFPSEHPFNGTVLCGAYSESKLPNGHITPYAETKTVL